MDALAQLALMAKAKLVFESPDTFLSFPALTPISYTPDQMRFADAASSQELQIFAEFSALTNALPQGTLFQPSLDRSLSDVYREVLQNAQLAQGSLTAQQTAQVQAAQGLLSAPGPSGLPVDSPAVVAYKQYQQVWFAATQDYNNQKVTASASTDPKIQAQWQNTGEPLARAQVQAAESDWETKGFKAQVEQSRQIEETYAAQSPQLKWRDWTAACNPAIDFLTDPTGNGTFGPTVFAPYDIFDHGAWPSFSIAGSDIANLVNQAPAELKAIFGTQSGSSEIDSLSFEYCSVALARHWFQPDPFYARFWRFADPTVQLSDGNVPPAGSWPAYIAAVVFARNIVVKSHGTGAVQPQPLRSFPPLVLASVHAAPPPAARPVSAAPPPHPAPAVAARVAPAPQPMRVAAVAGRPGSVAARPLILERVEVVQPRPAVVPVHATVVQPHPAVVQPHPAPPPAAAARPIAINPALRAQIHSATYARAVQTGPPPAPATPPPSQTQSSGNEISILAFICKRLPKCPNPDPSLNWT